MMTACSPLTRLSKVEIPANLMQPCPQLNEIQGNTGKDWITWGVDTVPKYNECALQNDAWIKIGKALQ